MNKSVIARQWVTYATFYLCRVNFAIIAPLLMSLLGFTMIDIGLISSGLLAAYAVGQFINGQLADKYAKRLLSIGMFGSAAMNFIMAFTPVPLMMFIFWTANGFFQSMGWSSSVKIVANWYSHERGKMSGILGTSYQIGNVLSWLLAGYVVLLGWRWGFIIPAILFTISGIHWTLKGKQAPEETGLKTIENYEDNCDTHLGFKWTLRKCVDWKVGAGAFTLFFLNIIRYGFLTWAPTYLFALNPEITSVALTALLFPLAGSLGGLTIGLLERENKKIRIGLVFLPILAGLMLVYPTLKSDTLALVFLAGIGFFTYAPHVFTVTRLPMLLGTRKGAASVTGFIDMMGYVGATITGIATAYLKTIGGWNLAFAFWTTGAILSAFSLASLWNYEEKQEKYL